MFEQFHWKSSDGTEIVVPHIKSIKGAVIRRHRKLGDLDMMFSILEDTASPEALAQVDELSHDDLNKFFADWQQPLVGESSRSST